MAEKVGDFRFFTVKELSATYSSFPSWKFFSIANLSRPLMLMLDRLEGNKEKEEGT